MRKTVNVLKNDSGEFYYINLGAKEHFRPVSKLWIPKTLLRKIAKKCEKTGELYIEFPVRKVRLERGKKDLVLKPGLYNLFYYRVDSGYRGTAEIDEIDSDGKSIYTQVFVSFDSEQGSLGVSKEILVLTSHNCLEIQWSRTGDLRETPEKGVTIICINGTVQTETIEDIDICSVKRLAILLGIHDPDCDG